MRVIEGAIPTLIFLMIIKVVMMTWFILSAVPFENIGSSFSHWITNVTVTTVTVSTVNWDTSGCSNLLPNIFVCALLEIILPTHSFKEISVSSNRTE